MKKNIIKSLLAIVCLLCSISVYAHDFEVNGIYYKIRSSDEVVVTYGGINPIDYVNEYTGTVIIPESVTYQSVDFSVTSIGSDAFYKCTDLTEITIPNSVTSISDHAFHGCTGLTEVTIPNSVTSIYDSAFYGCI